jgi:hypothetical protein
MAAPVPYFALVREMKDAYNLRRRLVEYARRYGTCIFLALLRNADSSSAAADNQRPLRSELIHCAA